MMQTAVVRMTSEDSSEKGILVRALLDSGSQVGYVRHRLCYTSAKYNSKSFCER